MFLLLKLFEVMTECDPATTIIKPKRGRLPQLANHCSNKMILLDWSDAWLSHFKMYFIQEIEKSSSCYHLLNARINENIFPDITDCLDGSDEEDCSTLFFNCNPTSYRYRNPNEENGKLKNTVLNCMQMVAAEVESSWHIYLKFQHLSTLLLPAGTQQGFSQKVAKVHFETNV